MATRKEIRPDQEPERERPSRQRARINRAQERLGRERVLRSALGLVDAHGLDALSMRALGAELGVEAMALYNHVGGKQDLLGGIAELLWEEVESRAAEVTDWRTGLHSMARAIREVLRGHPHAAPLAVSYNPIPVPGLRLCDTRLRLLRAAGHSEAQAIEALRTVLSFAAGYAIAEVTCLQPSGTAAGESDLGRLRWITGSLPAGTPDRLVEVALALCGECDVDAVFEAGLQSLIRGFEANISRGPDNGSETGY